MERVGGVGRLQPIKFAISRNFLPTRLEKLLKNWSRQKQTSMEICAISRQRMLKPDREINCFQNYEYCLILKIVLNAYRFFSTESYVNIYKDFNVYVCDFKPKHVEVRNIEREINCFQNYEYCLILGIVFYSYLPFSTES